jgi:hypothetical protein
VEQIPGISVCIHELGTFFDAEEIMPHRRRVQKGSFGSHFDELVARFQPSETPPRSAGNGIGRSAKLQEKIDIHALLFERAWKLDDEP